MPRLPVDEPLNETLEVSAMPNPSKGHFNLDIKGDKNNPVTIRVTDISGRVIEQYEKVSANSILKIGRKLKGGSCFVEVIQADQRRFVKIIKVN
jgi:hypothetical protein